MGQSNANMYYSDPADLPASAIDANIPYNNSGGGANFTPDSTDITYLRPQLKADGGISGFDSPLITIPAGFSSHGYGVEMVLGRRFYDPGRKIAVTRVAFGGTSLGNVGEYPYWHNPQSPRPDMLVGFNITEFVAYINGMRAHLTGLGRTSQLLFIFDCQGEADAVTDLSASEYGFHKMRQIKFLRALLGENVPFILCLTKRSSPGGTAETLEKVNDGKRLCASTLPGVIVYDPSDDIPIWIDDVHWWDTASILMGNEVYDAAIEMGIP